MRGVSPDDQKALLTLAREKKVDLTVVGPEAPLVDGLADLFQAEGLLVAGPSAQAALLEGSKAFCKDFMAQNGVPTADYRIFDSPEPARDYVRSAGRRLVLKADGLAAGKGVLLCHDVDEALAAIDMIMVDKKFGDAGDRIVVEDWLEGEEASFLVFTDGHTIVPMPTSQDHKAIGEGDTGLNTGGMGAYSPAPVVTPEITAKVMKQVIEPVVGGMARRGTPYQGILYAGLMIDEKGDPSVLEFNVRFGDPECQPLLMRLESDLAELLMLLAQGRLNQADVVWSPDPTVCVVLAAGGYPEKYAKGASITGLEAAGQQRDVVVFHAGTALDGQQVVTSGGRVLGVTARGGSIQEAISRAYSACSMISWQDMYYRRDIGHRALTRAASAPRVGILMGSANDWADMKKAREALDALQVPCEVQVLSAHRTPQQAATYAASARERGIKVIIAGAGWAAHLAGAMAAHTVLPIIGVPIASSPLSGLDSLLATVQMPPGIPVATVALGSGGAYNAGILAAQMLALSDSALSARLRKQREEMAGKVLAASSSLK